MPNIEALTRLREIIVAAPEDNLHMLTFTEKARCGTAYCAVGFAACDPWFQERGIKFGQLCRYMVQMGPVPDVFGISLENSNTLFAYDYDDINANCMDPHCITKQEVLDNIDRLLRGEDAKTYDALIHPLDFEIDDYSDEEDY